MRSRPYARFIVLYAVLLLTLAPSRNSSPLSASMGLMTNRRHVSKRRASSGPNHCDRSKVACWAAHSRSYSQPGCRLPISHACGISTAYRCIDHFPYWGKAFPAPTARMKLQAAEESLTQFLPLILTVTSSCAISDLVKCRWLQRLRWTSQTFPKIIPSMVGLGIPNLISGPSLMQLTLKPLRDPAASLQSHGPGSAPDEASPPPLATTVPSLPHYSDPHYTSWSSSATPAEARSHSPPVWLYHLHAVLA